MLLSTAAAVRISQHWESWPGGVKRGKGGRWSGARPGPAEGRRKRRHTAQSLVRPARVWRRDQALNLAFHSFRVQTPPPTSPELRTLPASPRISGSFLAKVRPCEPVAIHFCLPFPGAPRLLRLPWPVLAGWAGCLCAGRSLQPGASQDAARRREVWSGRTLYVFFGVAAQGGCCCAEQRSHA